MWKEKADAEIKNMTNCCASGYTLKKTEKRDPDDDAEADKTAANVSAWRAKSYARPIHTHN